MSDNLTEARRQLQICNACRYCEGYCSAFPAITRLRAFEDGDITQIANLCHNCQGCYYACQYTAPHEFALNLPKILAEVRSDTWENYVWPRPLGALFQRHAWGTVLITVLGFAVMFGLLRDSGTGAGFYAWLSHSAMVALFAPAFILPLISLAIGLRWYWQDVGGKPIKLTHIKAAFANAASMKNLSGGHGEGCNFEREERFTPHRRWAHHLIMYGFLLCFASTSSATVLHYVFDIPAPYPLLSLPKVLGISGGVMLTLGCIWMLHLKRQTPAETGNTDARSAEAAFIALLGFVAASGLALYVLGSTSALPALLALHLGSVLSFFILTPYTKMAHGFFRLAALTVDEQKRSG